jgi:Ca-activated chloride channel family protein
MEANGGTNILEGLQQSLSVPADPRRLRLIVCNTDGYVGNEPEILDAIVKDRSTTRIFTFGVGNGVNRFLIDTMSLEGRGDSETVTLSSEADGAVARFLQRTRSPILTDITTQFSGVEVQGVYPSQIPDVFSEKPIVLHGRYENPGQGQLTISGLVGGMPWSQTLNLHFGAESNNPAIESLWARKKIEDLTSKSYLNMLRPDPRRDSISEQIIDTALDFHIMSQYTSFVAVEPKVVNVGGRQYTVRVPVEMTDGVEMIDGVQSPRKQAQFGGTATLSAAKAAPASSSYNRSVIADERIDANPPTPEERYQQKVDRKLRESSGPIDVMVWLSATDDATLKALKQAGLKIEIIDKRIAAVFGTCDAKKLKGLSQLPSVERIAALEG